MRKSITDHIDEGIIKEKKKVYIISSIVLVSWVVQNDFRGSPGMLHMNNNNHDNSVTLVARKKILIIKLWTDRR